MFCVRVRVLNASMYRRTWTFSWSWNLRGFRSGDENSKIHETPRKFSTAKISSPTYGSVMIHPQLAQARLLITATHGYVHDSDVIVPHGAPTIVLMHGHV